MAQGQLTHCRWNLRNLATALEMYSADNGGRYPLQLGQLRNCDPQRKPYIRKLPTCPAAGWVTYGYQVSAGPDNFTLSCQGSNHMCANPRAPRDWPRYVLAESQLLREP